MKRISTSFVIAGLLLAQAMVSASASTVPLTIVYSGNLDGELEPCGCSDEGNLGGIKRRTTMLDNIKDRNPNAVIVSSGGLIASEGTNDYLKAVYILRAFSSLRRYTSSGRFHLCTMMQLVCNGKT